MKVVNEFHTLNAKILHKVTGIPMMMEELTTVSAVMKVAKGFIHALNTTLLKKVTKIPMMVVRTQVLHLNLGMLMSIF